MGLVRRQLAVPVEAVAVEPLDTTALLRALDDPDPDRRREAALGLDGVAEAVPALLARLGAEAEPTVRDAVLTTLAAADTPPVAAGLVPHLSSDDAGLRTAVADALATMPRSAPSFVPGLLADSDHDVRIMAAMVSADLHHERAESWLCDLIRDDPHPNVVAAAIDALLPAAGPQHAALLRSVPERFPDDPFLHFTVEAALPGLTGAQR